MCGGREAALRAAVGSAGSARAVGSTALRAALPTDQKGPRSRAGLSGLPNRRLYSPASNASFDGVAAIRLISHSIADCGGI
jgi:hypothetical protein